MSSRMCILLMFLSGGATLNCGPQGRSRGTTGCEPASCPAWSDRAVSQFVIHRRMADPLVEFDFSATVRASNESEDTVFYWGGSIIGKGAEGFNRLLERIREVRPGSRILLYPYIDLLDELDGSVRSLVGPWDPYLQRLEPVAKAKQVYLILSPRDPQGRLCVGAYTGEPEKDPL
jgi:hypothetical protein